MKTNQPFAQLILTALFIHGLGGDRYDEMTDDITRTFFGIDPPPFMVMTATLRLPLGELFPARPEDGGRIRWTMNDQRWNPERYLPPSERAAALARKISIVESIGRGRPPTQIEQLRELRAGWLGGIADSMANVRKETVTVERQLAANRRLASRDFAWPLHPRETLETLWDRLRDALAIG